MGDPISLIQQDREEARKLEDALVDRCFLATVRPDGEPAVRTLVLRELEGDYAIFCNLTSPKVEQFKSSEEVEVLLWYPSVSIQYRLKAVLEKIPSEKVHAQWLNKSETTKRIDFLYESHPQSSEIEGREWLKEQVASIQLEDKAPNVVGGFFLRITRVERLDLATEDGIHDRKAWTLQASDWIASHLMP